MKEFSSVAELKAHYRAVIARRPPVETQARPPTIAPPVAPPAPAPAPPPPIVVPHSLPPSAHMIARVVCEHYGIEWPHIASDKRNKAVIRPRHVFCFICYRVAKMSLPYIGRVANRDHSTVLNASKNIERAMLIDADLAHDVATILLRYEEERNAPL